MHSVKLLHLWYSCVPAEVTGPLGLNTQERFHRYLETTQAMHRWIQGSVIGKSFHSSHVLTARLRVLHALIELLRHFNIFCMLRNFNLRITISGCGSRSLRNTLVSQNNVGKGSWPQSQSGIAFVSKVFTGKLGMARQMQQNARSAQMVLIRGRILME